MKPQREGVLAPLVGITRCSNRNGFWTFRREVHWARWPTLMPPLRGNRCPLKGKNWAQTIVKNKKDGSDQPKNKKVGSPLPSLSGGEPEHWGGVETRLSDRPEKSMTGSETDANWLDTLPRQSKKDILQQQAEKKCKEKARRNRSSIQLMGRKRWKKVATCSCCKSQITVSSIGLVRKSATLLISLTNMQEWTAWILRLNHHKPRCYQQAKCKRKRGE